MSTSKVFIVTGASKGIGAAVTRKLISDSHKVVLAARSAKLLEQIKSANPDQIEYVAGDMTDPEVRTCSYNHAKPSLTMLSVTRSLPNWCK